MKWEMQAKQVTTDIIDVTSLFCSGSGFQEKYGWDHGTCLTNSTSLARANQVKQLQDNQFRHMKRFFVCEFSFIRSCHLIRPVHDQISGRLTGIVFRKCFRRQVRNLDSFVLEPEIWQSELIHHIPTETTCTVTYKEYLSARGILPLLWSRPASNYAFAVVPLVPLA